MFSVISVRDVVKIDRQTAIYVIHQRNTKDANYLEKITAKILMYCNISHILYLSVKCHNQRCRLTSLM